MKQAETFRSHSASAILVHRKKRKKKGFRVAICQNHGLTLIPFFYASIPFLSCCLPELDRGYLSTGSVWGHCHGLPAGRPPPPDCIHVPEERIVQ